jgi:Protein of unknown function (DUF3631)
MSVQLIHDALNALGLEPRETGEEQWRVRCPACGNGDNHDDALIFGSGIDDKPWLRCYYEPCSIGDVLDALGLEGKQLWGDGEQTVPSLPAPDSELVRWLLEQLEAIWRDYIVMPEPAFALIAVADLHTWLFDAAETTLYISLRAPERESGKTRGLEVSELTCRMPHRSEDVSPASLFRLVDQYRPTVLIDEVDTIFSGRDGDAAELRRLLNGGYRLGGKATRVEERKGERKVLTFSTYSPKRFAGIGRLPDTIESRCIPINMKRKKRSEPIKRFRQREVKERTAPVRQRLLELPDTKLVEVLRDARPELPDELTDRQQEGVEPLLAIADYAGGDWPQRAREAAVELLASAGAIEDSRGVRLLGDCRTTFEDAEALHSVDLVERLRNLEGSAWGEGDDFLTEIKLSNMLRAYGIAPHPIQMAKKQRRGYRKAQFEDAWDRYCPIPSTGALPADQPVNPSTSQSQSEKQGISTRQPPDQVDGSENGSNPHSNAEVDGLTGKV